VSFRREKFIPKGGPDGGDGGKGGSVYIETDSNLATLQDFAHNKKFAATDGKKGGGKKMSGLKGEDLTIKVPVGTLVRLVRLNQETRDEVKINVRGMKMGAVGTLIEQSPVMRKGDEVIDLDAPGMRIRLAQGGQGGKGNVHFKSSKVTTPLVAMAGQPGEAFEALLELKLLADIGLVGLPNAGKSTLLSVLSNARPKIADYEFTTLEPNLGVLKAYDKHLVIADIPGLIEGASEGKGLGTQFLKHIERTKTLVHLVPSSDQQEEEIFDKYKTIRTELKNYGVGLEDKKEVVVLSKTDLVDEEKVKKIVSYFSKKKIKLIPISSANQDGIQELIKAL